MTLRVIGVPSALVGGAVALVYFGRGADAALSSPDEFRRMFFSMSRRLFLVGGLVFVPLAVSSPWLLPWILGSQWRPAGLYVTVLSPMYCAGLVSFSLSATVVITERQGLFLLRETVRAGLICTFYGLARWLTLSPLASIALLSAAGTLGYVFYYLVSRQAVLGYHGRS